jgi:phosphonatase-like hydrolase
MGIPKPLAIKQLIATAPKTVHVRKEGGAIHADFVARMIAFYRSDPSVQEIAGTTTVFERLHRAGIKVALDTGFSRDIADIIIDRLGWNRPGLLDASVTSDEVKRGRPFPDMIERLMQKLNIKQAVSVAKVGDTPSDLEEGKNAGCGRNIGVTRGSHTREELARYPHTDLIETVVDLPALLGL